MRNQPKYSFFKNTSYALNGLKDLLTTETSFKIEIILAFILTPIIIILDTSLVYKLLMFISLMMVLIAEVTNSAIERAVDLVTLEHHPMAGRAKDVGSTIVFLSIIMCVVVWGFILLDIF
ncbi:MAG: diacylglycerol kinase [Campylobacteraceae bacterium]|jgi:diacylglycerol kinase (ATP)|nr:diacylglycerol kinase [Campylobacteraceae bacterium]MBT4030936.1 diacylglycerol kinase [Campylobacteraceae bacterium]MBT4179703.1 diacylglycerol kinase [Campylobacteraceae bacterium]MBT4571900.1 diacylglycerol kinase [Campylobacteraceae bacterium]MBT4708429.1 diacylglycerol kinase [Campylobacteraceae bacterium]